MTQIIQFTEKDVDGCGTDVDALIALETGLCLTHGHVMRLKSAIRDINQEWEPEMWDTNDVINEAMRRVFGKDAEYQFITPDIAVEF